MTILVVDDELEIRETLKDIFEDEGHDVALAADGMEALAALRDGVHPDLVVLDLVMPRLDGAEVYKAMKDDAALAKIPVVISTALPSRAPVGARVLRKPLNLDALMKTVTELC